MHFIQFFSSRPGLGSDNDEGATQLMLAEIANMPKWEVDVDNKLIATNVHDACTPYA